MLRKMRTTVWVIILPILFLLTRGHALQAKDPPADLLHSCPTPPDSYYRFPFDGNSGWKLVKGNWDDKKNGHDTKDGQPQSYSYDFTNSAGTEGWQVRAARSGRVAFVYSSQSANTLDSIPDPPGSRGEGNMVEIRHLDGSAASYAHLQMSKVFVAPDEYVPRGRVIALAGNTGSSGGPHLHFDVHPSFTDWDNWVPTMRIAFQDTEHICWRPQVGDTLSPDNHVSGLTFSALFSPVSKTASFLSGMSFSEFTAAWADLGNTSPTQDMLTFHAYVEGGQRRFTGLFIPGKGGQAFVAGLDFTEFVKEWAKQGKANNDMIAFDTYLEGGKRKFAGLFGAGKGGQAFVAGLDFTGFVKEWAKQGKANNDMIAFDTYPEGGKRKFAGLFGPGKGGQAFVAGLDFTEFVKEWAKQGKANNDMIAFRSYPEAGGIRFAGLFRPGSGGQRFISGVSFDDVVAEWRKTPPGGGSVAMAATSDE